MINFRDRLRPGEWQAVGGPISVGDGQNFNRIILVRMVAPADGGRLSKSADWQEGHADAMKDSGLSAKILKKHFEAAHKRFASISFVDQEIRQYWEGKRDAYEALLKAAEERENNGGRLASASEENADELRAKSWQRITSDPLPTEPADPAAVRRAVEAFHVYVDTSRISFNERNWDELDYAGARRRTDVLADGRRVVITLVPYRPDAERSVHFGIALIECAGELVGHAFYNYDQPESKGLPRRGTVYPAFGIHADFQGKVSSGRIYEIYLKVLDGMFSPEFYKIQLQQVINREPGSDETRAIFYLNHGYRPPNFVYAYLFSFADDIYLRLRKNEQLAPGALSKMVDVMHRQGYPGAFWTSPWLGEEEGEAQAARLANGEGGRLAQDFGKPDGRRLSSAGAVTSSIGNRRRLLALSAQKTDDVYFGFRENGAEAWTGMLFENTPEGGKDAVFYYWDEKDDERREFGRIRLTPKDLEAGRRLLKRHASLRDARLQAGQILKSRALQFVKEDRKDELEVRRLDAAFRKAGAAISSRPVVYLVDAASLHADTALQFASMISERKKGNRTYANTYFVFHGVPPAFALVSDDLSGIAAPETMKLVYYGDPATATASKIADIAGPVAERYRLDDRRVGVAPVEPALGLGKGEAPHYRVAGIVLTNALLQRLDLRAEDLAVLRGGFRTQFENAIGHGIDEDQFTIPALQALQEFSESHKPTVYVAFAARARKVDFEVIAEYAMLKRQLDMAA